MKYCYRAIAIVYSFALLLPASIHAQDYTEEELDFLVNKALDLVDTTGADPELEWEGILTSPPNCREPIDPADYRFPNNSPDPLVFDPNRDYCEDRKPNENGEYPQQVSPQTLACIISGELSTCQSEIPENPVEGNPCGGTSPSNPVDPNWVRVCHQTARVALCRHFRDPSRIDGPNDIACQCQNSANIAGAVRRNWQRAQRCAAEMHERFYQMTNAEKEAFCDDWYFFYHQRGNNPMPGGTVFNEDTYACARDYDQRQGDELNDHCNPRRITPMYCRDPEDGNKCKLFHQVFVCGVDDPILTSLLEFFDQNPWVLASEDGKYWLIEYVLFDHKPWELRDFLPLDYNFE